MALVHDDQRVFREIVEQRRGRLAGLAARQVAGVVLDPVAVADLLDHLQVEHRPLVQPLRLEQPAFALEVASPLDELLLDRLDGSLGPVARGDEVRFRVDGDLVMLS